MRIIYIDKSPIHLCFWRDVVYKRSVGGQNLKCNQNMFPPLYRILSQHMICQIQPSTNYNSLCKQGQKERARNLRASFCVGQDLVQTNCSSPFEIIGAKATAFQLCVLTPKRWLISQLLMLFFAAF